MVYQSKKPKYNNYDKASLYLSILYLSILYLSILYLSNIYLSILYLSNIYLSILYLSILYLSILFLSILFLISTSAMESYSIVSDVNRFRRWNHIQLCRTRFRSPILCI